MERTMIWPGRHNSEERSPVGVGGTAALFALAVCLGASSKPVAGQPVAQPSAPSAHAPAVSKLSGHPVEAGQQTFSSAAEASRALVNALQHEDVQALLKVLGTSAKEIISSGD